MASLAQLLKLSIFSEKTFYNIQDKYLFPVINEVWEGEQNAVFDDLKNKELWLSGNGRCDSPGHSVKCGTYTMIDQNSNSFALHLKRALIINRQSFNHRESLCERDFYEATS